jgi:hypothetical protein
MLILDWPRKILKKINKPAYDPMFQGNGLMLTANDAPLRELFYHVKEDLPGSWLAVLARDGNGRRYDDRIFQYAQETGIRPVVWMYVANTNDAQLLGNYAKPFPGFIANCERELKVDEGGSWGLSKEIVDALRPYTGKKAKALSTYGHMPTTIDYQPWINAGYSCMPQAYPSVGNTPVVSIALATIRGFKNWKVHPTLEVGHGTTKQEYQMRWSMTGGFSLYPGQVIQNWNTWEG